MADDDLDLLKGKKGDDLNLLAPRSTPPMSKKDKDYGPGTENKFEFWPWLRSQAQKGATSIYDLPKTLGDTNEIIAQKLMEQFGVDAETARRIAPSFRGPFGDPLKIGPTGAEANEKINEALGQRDVSAPENWGVPGKILDASVQGTASALTFPGGGLLNLVRSGPRTTAALIKEASKEVAKGVPVREAVATAATSAEVQAAKELAAAARMQTIKAAVPGATAGAASEAGGQAAKEVGLPEAPFRIAGGLFAGGGTAYATKGVGGVPKADEAGHKASILFGKNVLRDDYQSGGPPVQVDRLPGSIADLAAEHALYGPGTPLAIAAGPNVRGSVRGATTSMGPARDIVGTGLEKFVASADERVGPLIDRISPLGATREADLRAQAGAGASPLYEASGANLGSNVRIASPEIGKFMESGLAQETINRLRKLPSWTDEPIDSMAMVDKVYKDLGSRRGNALNSGDTGLAADIKREQEKLAGLIGKENPKYAEALKAFRDPQELADAFKLGRDLASKNVDPDSFERVFKGLRGEAEQKEFLGGVATWARGKVGSSGRATPAERFWSTDWAKERLKRILPEDDYNKMAGHLDREVEAARRYRELRFGSSTANKLSEQADTASAVNMGDVVDVAQGGIVGPAQRILARQMEKRRNEAGLQRLEDVNTQTAQMAMETTPQGVGAVSQRILDAYRRQQQIDAANRSAYTGAGAATASQTTPLVQQLVQGLLNR